MEWPSIASTLPRAVHLAAVLMLFGCLMFRRFVATGYAPVRPPWPEWTAAGFGLMSGVVWLASVAGSMAGSNDIAGALAATPLVASHTSFGHGLCVRLLLLIAVAPLLGRRGAWSRGAALLCAGVALALQPLLGHIGASESPDRTVLLLIEAAHLLAAGTWAGGLVLLLIAVAREPTATAATLCDRFSAIGMAAVGTIAFTAPALAWEQIGDIGGLLGTAYGRLALVKLGLFVLALGLACLNRFVLTARLPRTGGRGALIGSIAVETAILLCVVVAAAALASTAPAAHVQPVWPWSWRPSLSAWDDPATHGELARLLTAACVALVLIVGGVILRRFRFLAIGLGFIVVLPFTPALSLLFVEAWPTSYMHSTTGFSVDAIATGQTLFNERCAVCHDPLIGSRGDGDLTAPHVWGHLDGELFWRITEGVLDEHGDAVMPGFGSVLSEDERWALIDFIRARNIGRQVVATGHWAPAVAAPLTPLRCAGLDAGSTADLGGRLLVVEAGEPSERIGGAVTIRLARDIAASPGQGECVAASASAWDAWAVLAGVPPERFAGYRAVVDARGWLRAWLSPDADVAATDAALREARDHPIERTTVAHHH